MFKNPIPFQNGYDSPPTPKEFKAWASQFNSREYDIAMMSMFMSINMCRHIMNLWMEENNILLKEEEQQD